MGIGMEKENTQDAAEKQREKADLWKKMTDENAARAEREWQREEEAANRAARELQEKKKKRRRKIRIAVLIICLLAAAGIYGDYRYQQYQKEKASQEADVLALAEDEELVYGKITKAVGNDITVTVLDVKTDIETDDGQGDDSDSGKSADGNPFGKESSESSTSNVENAKEQETVAQSEDGPGKAGEETGASGNGNMPDGAPQGMNRQGGSAPDAEGQGSAPGGDFGNDGSQSTDAKGAESQGAGSQSPETSGSQMQSTAPQQNMLQYTETSQTKEYEVPVGTEVTTRLGATTSFSRLSTGNIVGIVVQKGTDNILRIKIVE